MPGNARSEFYGMNSLLVIGSSLQVYRGEYVRYVNFNLTGICILDTPIHRSRFVSRPQTAPMTVAACRRLFPYLVRSGSLLWSPSNTKTPAPEMERALGKSTPHGRTTSADF